MRARIVKISSIVGAMAALAVAISLVRKMPVAHEIRQTVTALAPVAEGEISFSH